MKELLQLALGSVFSGRPRGIFVPSFGRPAYPEAGWVPHSVVFASGEDSVCVPLANDGVGFGLLLLALPGPVASRPPLGIGLLRGLAVIFFTLAFSCAGLPHIEAC